MASSTSPAGRLLGALAVATFAVALFQSLVSPVLAAFEQRLDVGVSASTWLVTAYLLSLALTTPISGRLGDRFGRRRMLLAVLAIALAGTVTAALAESLPLLILGRILQGIGGGVFPLSFALVREHLPPERVAGAIGMLSSLLGAGAGVGIAGAGAVVDGLGVPALFWLPGALLLAGLLAVLRWVPAGGTGATRRTEGDARDRRPGFRRREVVVGNVVGVLLNVGLFAAFLLLPRVAADAPDGADLALAATAAGGLMVPLSLLMLCVAPVAGRLDGRFGPRPLLVAGCLVAAAGFGLVLIAVGIASLLLASACVGLGMGLAYGTVTSLVARAVSADDVGAATGVVTMTRTVGGAASAQVVGALIALGSVAGAPQLRGFQHGFGFAALSLVAGALVALMVPGRADRPVSRRPARPGPRPRRRTAPGAAAPAARAERAGGRPDR